MYEPIDTLLDDPDDGVTIQTLNDLIHQINARFARLEQDGGMPPCPICGSPSVETMNYQNRGRHAISCRNDDCLIVVQDTPEAAREAWLLLCSHV